MNLRASGRFHEGRRAVQIAKKRLGAVLLAVCLLAALAFGGIAAYAVSAGTGNNTLTVNATNWDIKALTPAVADFALRWFEQRG